MTTTNATVSPNRSATIMFVAALLVFAGVILLIVFIRSGNEQEVSRAPAESPAIGRRFDGLTLHPLLGEAQPLGIGDLEGKVAVINFWGPWCAPCRMEMPHLVELKNRLDENPAFAFVSISCSPDYQSEDPTRLRNETYDYFQQRGYDFDVHLDPNGLSRKALLTLAEWNDQGFSFPTTLVVDQRGTIRAIWIGYNERVKDEIARVVGELLPAEAASQS